MASTQYYDIILKPLAIEKSMAGMVEKRYCFLAHPETNETVIKEAVEKMFASAKTKSVNTMDRSTKIKRRGMTVGQTTKSKKVIVQFTADSKKTEIFQGLQCLKLCGVNP